MTPLPDTSDPLAAPHWAAARAGRLEMQRCERCGYVRWPVARVCPECLAEGGVWTSLSGRGTIWSFAVYRQAIHPAFAEQVPYAVALVSLAEGPMVHGRVEGDPDALACGQRVTAHFVALSPEVSVARFRAEEPRED